MVSYLFQCFFIVQELFIIILNKALPEIVIIAIVIP